MNKSSKPTKGPLRIAGPRPFSSRISKVLRPEHLPVVPPLPLAPSRELHRPVLHDVRPVEPVRVRRLEHRRLGLGESLVEPGRPRRRRPPFPVAVPPEVRPAVRARRRREAVQRRAALDVGPPRPGPVDGPLGEEHDVPGPRDGVDDVLPVLVPVDHTRGHGEVALVRPGHDAEAAVVRPVLPAQDDVAPQQARSDLSRAAAVGEVRAVLARDAVDGPPVQGEALPAPVVHEHEGDVVEAVPPPEYAREQRPEAGVGEDRLEDPALPGVPLEYPPQVEAGGPVAVHGRSPRGVPERGVRPGHGLVRVGRYRGVAGGDLVGRQYAPHDEEAVQVEEVPLGVRHGRGMRRGDGAVRHPRRRAEERRRVRRCVRPVRRRRVSEGGHGELRRVPARRSREGAAARSPTGPRSCCAR
mmetsp:Transcript_10726/g.23319  ORF Transcript_10726/g.23319 Transcript_10726/m.23319 type:complete len:412 (-) Transcript_10726:419-1654(-)